MLLRQIYFLPKILTREWKKKEEIERISLKMLKSLLKDVYCINSFYRKKFGKLDLTNIKTVDDLKMLPITTKEEMRNHFPQHLSAGYTVSTCVHESTSGSTGDVLDIYHDISAYDYYDCIVVRVYKGYNYKLTDKIAYTRFKPMKKELCEYFNIFRRYYIPVHSEANDQLAILSQVNPAVISAYPSSLHEMAKEMDNYKTNPVNPKFIISHSELLTERIKEYIESVFGCPVYRDYSAFEVHNIANECTHGSMHLHLDNTLVEVIKDGEPAAPGETGEIVVTNLSNRAMPFIRYKTGDIGALDEDTCTCGRGLPLLKMIEGRKDEHLILPSGRKVSPRIFDLLNFSFHQYLFKFQIIQKEKDKIVINIVKKETYNDKITVKLIEETQKYLGESITVEVVEVDDIQRTGRGKFRAVICEVMKSQNKTR